jgi:hypothetical protein
VKFSRLKEAITKSLPWWLTTGKGTVLATELPRHFVEHVRGKRLSLSILPADGTNMFSPQERERLIRRIAQKVRSLGLIVEEWFQSACGIRFFCRWIPT